MKPALFGRLKQSMRAIPRQLASVKLGAMLIIAIFAFTLLAAFFPATVAVGFVRSIGQALALENISRVGELSFQERFESPPFIVLIAVLSLSLCFSLYFRIRGELKRWRSARDATLHDAALQPQTGLVGAVVASIEQELKLRGYQTHVACADGAWKVHGNKGGSGVWGSLLFHVGILLVLAAVVLSTSASFRASVKLTEGEAFDARVDQFGAQRAGRWYTPGSQPLTFRLVRVEPDYEVKGATTVASIVEPTLEGKSSRFSAPAPVYISNGLRHAGVTIHQGLETGYAPQVMIEDAAGQRLLQGFTRLATLAGPEKVSHLDHVDIADKGVRIEFELLPDAVYRGGAYVSRRSAAPKNPVLHVVVREHGKVALDQFIPITREVSAGGYTVFFSDLRRWSQLDVTDAPGVPVLMAATLLGSLGLLLRLLSVRRRIVVTLPAAGVNHAVAFDVTGSSEKFQRMFEEELDALRTALSGRLATLAGT